MSEQRELWMQEESYAC